MTHSANDLLSHLLGICLQQDASDIHLAGDQPPYLRLHGVLEPQNDLGIVSSGRMIELADIVGKGFDKTPLEKTGSLDGAFTAPDGTRYRFNVYRRQGSLAIALRRLEDKFRSLADLGLPDSLYHLCDHPDGLVIVCGPTGAGKSTTLATLIDRINGSRRSHIVTIEDPIEYLHTPKLSLVNQRQVGMDTSSFNDALVASLRQDPDVILVGEIRDLNTIRTAITAAETGHLVFTTVHAGDCVGAVERLVSVFPADEQSGIRRQLSMVLRAIITQHLVVADGPAGLMEGNRRRRVVASEILINMPAIANLIATGKSNQIYSSIETSGPLGMQTMEQDLARLWMSNWISEGTALNMARLPQSVKDRAQMMRRTPLRPGVPQR